MKKKPTCNREGREWQTNLEHPDMNEGKVTDQGPLTGKVVAVR